MLDIRVGIIEVVSMSSFQTLKDGGGDLEVLLRYSQTCKVPDRRDHVYAFLGLASPRYRIDANYESWNTPAMTFEKGYEANHLV
jgi:hypothetical protein